MGEKIELDRKNRRATWSSWGLVYEPAKIKLKPDREKLRGQRMDQWS